MRAARQGGGMMKAAHTREEASPTLAEVEAKLRAEYKNFTPEQRESIGDEPDRDTILCRWSRIHCSRMSKEEMAALRERGMAFINATATQPHDAHAVRS